MDGGSIHAQDLSRFPDRSQFSIGRFSRGLEAGNVAIPAEASDLIGGEAFGGCSLAALTIEDAGDDFIRIMNRQPM